MSNTAYDKTMENKYKIDIRLASNEKILFQNDIKTKPYVTKNI